MVAEPIKRPGVTFIADIPAGAHIMTIFYQGETAWVVAPNDSPPYILRLDGSREVINTDIACTEVNFPLMVNLAPEIKK